MFKMESVQNILNKEQIELIVKWHDLNFESIDDFSFECEDEFTEDFLSKIYEINYFKAINLAINDFIVNVLIKGK